MAETKIYISDGVDSGLRRLAMERFGYGRGSISTAVEEALVQWIGLQDSINSRLGKIVQVARGDRHAVAVILFGSYAAGDKGYRDIDVAIVNDGKVRSFDELGKYEDKGESAGKLIDISIFNDLPVDVQRRVLNDGKVLYMKDRDALYERSIETIRKWDDFRHIIGMAGELHG